MRSRQLSGYVCVLVSVLLLHATKARAQVDWSDLFPGEGSKPAAPQPRVAEPAMPAARPLPRLQDSPPKVARPRAVPVKTGQRVKLRPSRKIVQSRPEEEPEFPAAVDVAAPNFERQSQRSSRTEPAAQQVQGTRPEPEAAAQSVAKADTRSRGQAGAAPELQRAAVAVEPAPAPRAEAPRAEAPRAEALAPRAEPPQAPAAQAEVVAMRVDGNRDGASATADNDGNGALGFGLHPGDVISDKNVDKYKALLTPGLEWALHYGLRMNIVAPRRIALPRAYREATEKNSGQVKLSPDGARVLNWTSGQPFPMIDPNDPQVAFKIMWNFSYNGGVTDDLDLKNFDADTGAIGKNRGMSVERHYIIDNMRRLNYTGRIYVEPKPVMPNSEGLRYKESIHPLIEPFDLKGVGATFYRYVDPERQDDNWLYLPQLRRVRRLSSAQRSDALFGQDTDPDSYYGYNGQVGWMEWKFLGERTILAIMHATHSPVKWQSPEDWIFDDVWEPRQVYVLEGTSKLPQYAYGKRVLYIDKEGWIVPTSDIYDRAGQLWKVWINDYSYRKEAIPGAKLSRYPEEMPFDNALVMLDTQLVHATRAALPSTRTPDEECIFFNLGAKSGTSEDFFNVAHLIESGH